MPLFVFDSSSYYPYSAVIFTDRTDHAIDQITQAIREEYPELDVDGSSARRTGRHKWPPIRDVVRDNLREYSTDTPVLLERS